MASHRQAPGSMKLNSLAERIEDFVAWANQQTARHGMHSEAIPDASLLR
jgi:hypothetical protein